MRALPPVLGRGAPVSSSRVRAELARGDVGAARELLGRPYFVDAGVVRGEGRGRTLGVPTANLEPENEVLPARGVYAGRCRVPGGGWRLAVVNLGERPTFGGGRVTVEAHLLDFAGDLYGARVRLELHERLRDEERFAGPDALVAGSGRTWAGRAPSFRASPARGYSVRSLPMTELSVDTRELEGIVLLYPRGFINAHTVRLFEGEIQKALDRGRYRIVVSGAGLKYIASAGLGALMGVIEEVRTGGGTSGWPTSTRRCGTSSTSSASTTCTGSSPPRWRPC